MILLTDFVIYADDFPLAVEKLAELWCTIRCERIFKTHNYDVGKSVLRNMSGLFTKGPRSGHLLDTLPLHSFIKEHIDFENSWIVKYVFCRNLCQLTKVWRVNKIELLQDAYSASNGDARK